MKMKKPQSIGMPFSQPARKAISEIVYGFWVPGDATVVRYARSYSHFAVPRAWNDRWAIRRSRRDACHLARCSWKCIALSRRPIKNYILIGNLPEFVAAACRYITKLFDNHIAQLYVQHSAGWKWGEGDTIAICPPLHAQQQKDDEPCTRINMVHGFRSSSWQTQQPSPNTAGDKLKSRLANRCRQRWQHTGVPAGHAHLVFKAYRKTKNKKKQMKKKALSKPKVQVTVKIASPAVAVAVEFEFVGDLHKESSSKRDKNNYNNEFENTAFCLVLHVTHRLNRNPL